jgi:type III pantothenate kinase
LPVIQPRPVYQFRGLINAYDSPEQLGVDRWLALLAALHYHRGGMVVDVGTAVTLDVVAGHGQHIGGIILPGFGLLRQSLVSGTAALGLSDGQYHCSLATNTAEAIDSGCMNAVIGMIHHVMDQHPAVERIILTGGDAVHLLPWIKPAVVYDELLVLKGLQAYSMKEPIA